MFLYNKVILWSKYVLKFEVLCPKNKPFSNIAAMQLQNIFSNSNWILEIICLRLEKCPEIPQWWGREWNARFSTPPNLRRKILPHLNIPLTVFWKIGRHSGFKLQPIFYHRLSCVINMKKMLGTTKIFFPFKIRVFWEGHTANPNPV